MQLGNPSTARRQSGVVLCDMVRQLLTQGLHTLPLTEVPVESHPVLICCNAKLLTTVLIGEQSSMQMVGGGQEIQNVISGREA